MEKRTTLKEDLQRLELVRKVREELAASEEMYNGVEDALPISFGSEDLGGYDLDFFLSVLLQAWSGEDVHRSTDGDFNKDEDAQTWVIVHTDPQHTDPDRRPWVFLVSWNHNMALQEFRQLGRYDGKSAAMSEETFAAYYPNVYAECVQSIKKGNPRHYVHTIDLQHVYACSDKGGKYIQFGDMIIPVKGGAK